MKKVAHYKYILRPTIISGKHYHRCTVLNTYTKTNNPINQCSNNIIFRNVKTFESSRLRKEGRIPHGSKAGCS